MGEGEKMSGIERELVYCVHLYWRRVVYGLGIRVWGLVLIFLNPKIK